MRNTRLILVTGMSGAGKSTTSKSLSRQLSLNGVRCRWLHEECRRHPIRDGEFNIGSLYDPADLERNIQDMYRRWQRMVSRVQGCKIRVDTFGGQWDSHLQRLAEYFGLAYHPLPALVVENPKQYAGKYETFIGEQPHSIQLCPEPGGIYYQSFWPYMKLLPLGGARFEFASFPIRLTFHKDSAGQVRAVRVSGDYDWEIMGATMQRSPAGA